MTTTPDSSSTTASTSSSAPTSTASAGIRVDGHPTAPTMRWSRVAVVGFSCAVFSLLCIVVFALSNHTEFAEMSALVAVLGIPVGLILGIVALVTWKKKAQAAEAQGIQLLGKKLAIAAIVLSILDGAFGFLALVVMALGAAHGRRLHGRFSTLKRPQILLAPIAQSQNWIDPQNLTSSRRSLLDTMLTAPQKRVVADVWRQNGRAEHASIASFSRLSVDLLAVGAPMQLITHAHQDALDEVRHTETCFRIAALIDGEMHSPAAFPEVHHAKSRSTVHAKALQELAIEGLIDGALYEGVAADLLAKLAHEAATPFLQETLHGIAADERRHAEHGWEILQWCIQTGGLDVVQAVQHAWAQIPQHIAPTVSPETADGSLTAFGVHGAQLEAACYEARYAQLHHDVTHLCQQWMHTHPAVAAA